MLHDIFSQAQFVNGFLQLGYFRQIACLQRGNLRFHGLTLAVKLAPFVLDLLLACQAFRPLARFLRHPH